MPHETDFDRNWALTDNYEQGPRWFIPGYDASHAMAAVLLRDRIGDRGRILVVGAGVVPTKQGVGVSGLARLPARARAARASALAPDRSSIHADFCLCVQPVGCAGSADGSEKNAADQGTGCPDGVVA